MAAVPITTERRYQFDVAPEEFWGAISAVDRYQSWWPWLRRFEAERLGSGERWSCEVQPPVPYRVRFDIQFHEVVELERISVIVDGDIVGTASLVVTGAGQCCEVRLRSSLAPANRVLGVVTGVVPRLAQFGHDWVINTGAREFTSRAL